MTGRAALLLIFVLAPPLGAQGLGGGGLVYNVKRRVLYAGGVREQLGTLVGAEGGARLGPVRVGVAGLMGTLSGPGGVANPDVKARITTVTILLEPTPIVAVGAEVEAKRFEADAGVTEWRLIGATGRVALDLGVPGLVGTAQVSYFPSASIVNGATMSLAFRGTVGASYRSPRGPLTVNLGYRFERFDFKAVGSAPARLEQFQGLVLGAGFRLGR